MTDAMGQAELAALRARAYGRDADIHDDPEALRRLAELENAARSAADGASATGASVGGGEPHAVQLAQPQHPIAASASEVSLEPQTNLIEADEADEPESLESPASVPQSRWAWMLRPPVWIASLALTAVITAVATTMIVTHDPTVVARLHEIPREEWPKSIGDYGISDDLRVFEEYKGLTAVAGNMVVVGQPNMRCLYLVTVDGYASGSCQGEGIEPRADFIVGGEFGVNVGGAFADGTWVRVTLEGDTVVVRVAAPPATTAER